ncbi:MAG: hypothetical protein ACE5FS_08740 [Paracoccaceae bacterium]
MKHVAHRLGRFIDARYGRCTTCMRLAFRVSVLGWSAVIFADWLGTGRGVFLATVMLAMLLTVHAAVHILVFAWRRSTGGGMPGNPQTVKLGPHRALPIVRPRNPPERMSRRQVFRALLGNAAIAAAASAGLPRMARAACGDCAATFGAGYYDCITHFCNNVGQTCCPPGFPYLNHCDCICYDGTGFDCGSYSACQYCG